MTNRIRKHVYIDSGVMMELEALLTHKSDASLSDEVNAALQEYLRRQKAGREDTLLAPILDQLLENKLDQMESWLRSGVWAGATYSATATLLLLELLCGQTVDPKDAKAHLELIRGRAWKMVRKTTAQEGEA